MKIPFTALVLLLCTAIAAGCNGRPSAASKEASTAAQHSKDEIALTPEQQSIGMIQTQPATMSDAPDVLRVAGRIVLADDRTWHVGVRADGIVTAVFVGLGDHVNKGQVLARYHADEVREARAVYRKALAELNRSKSAEALSQRNLERAQRLLELKAGSQMQVDQARQDVMAAQTAVHAAQVEVDRGKDQLEDDLRVPADPAPGTPEEIADNVPILAPASGYIIQKMITPGKTIQTTGDTFVIGDLSQIWMMASVRQENLGQLRTGQSATVTLPGVSGARFTGKITNLGQQFDEATRVMHVRIALANPGNRLKPEMLADAEIPVGKSKPQLLVASDAIQQINDQDVVFVRTAPDRFSVRAVRAGETLGGKTPILDGLKPGEQVVVRGSFVLKGQLLKSTMESE